MLEILVNKAYRELEKNNYSKVIINLSSRGWIVDRIYKNRLVITNNNIKFQQVIMHEDNSETFQDVSFATMRGSFEEIITADFEYMQ